MHTGCTGLLQQQHGAHPTTITSQCGHVHIHTRSQETCTWPATACRTAGTAHRHKAHLHGWRSCAEPSSFQSESQVVNSSKANLSLQTRSILDLCTDRANPWTACCKAKQPQPHPRCINTGSNHIPSTIHTEASRSSCSCRVTRRQLLSATCIAATALAAWQSTLRPASAGLAAPSTCRDVRSPFILQPVDYTGPGPLQVVYLPMKLETVCTACFNSCAGTSCLLRLTVLYPKGGSALGLGPPYPLAIFTAGFLIGSDFYRSYAERLTSWGYTCLLYDKLETAVDALDDVTSVKALRQLMDWAGSDPLIRRVADTSRVYLIGHSRGGKLSALAAIPEYDRVRAICLLDPVDNTVYAPLSDNYPSAVAALKAGRRLPIKRAVGSSWLASAASSNQQEVRPEAAVAAQLPVAVIGSGVGSDCAPLDANFRRFHLANRGASWEVVIKEAGHFDYLDQVSPLQRALCPSGAVSDATVRAVSQAVMVAWGELMVRQQPVARLQPSWPAAGAYPAASAYPAACSPSSTADLQPYGHGRLQGVAQAGPSEGMPVADSRDQQRQLEERSTEVSMGAEELQVFLDRMLTGLRYQNEGVQVTSRYRNFDKLHIVP